MNAHEANVWAERLAREERALRKASPASELGDLQRQLHKIERDISSKLTAPAYGDSKSHMTGARERRKLRAQAEILERMQARVRNASDVAHRAEREAGRRGGGGTTRPPHDPSTFFAAPELAPKPPAARERVHGGVIIAPTALAQVRDALVGDARRGGEDSLWDERGADALWRRRGRGRRDDASSTASSSDVSDYDRRRSRSSQRLVLEVGREGERARNRPPSMRPLNLGLLEKQVKPWRGG